MTTREEIVVKAGFDNTAIASGLRTTQGMVQNFAGKVAGYLGGMFAGYQAISFARGLLDFAKTNPLLVIKGGVLDGKTLTAAEVGKLADLEPREVLLAKLAGAMKASMAGAAATFNALPTQMALLADALRAKLEAGSPASTAAEAPEAAPAAADTDTQTQD